MKRKESRREKLRRIDGEKNMMKVKLNLLMKEERKIRKMLLLNKKQLKLCC
jgi:hypothetical protein